MIAGRGISTSRTGWIYNMLIPSQGVLVPSFPFFPPPPDTSQLSRTQQDASESNYIPQHTNLITHSIQPWLETPTVSTGTSSAVAVSVADFDGQPIGSLERGCSDMDGGAGTGRKFLPCWIIRRPKPSGWSVCAGTLPCVHGSGGQLSAPGWGKNFLTGSRTSTPSTSDRWLGGFKV